MKFNLSRCFSQGFLDISLFFWWRILGWVGLARTGWPLLDTSAFGWEDLESFPKECLMPCTLTSLQISGLNCSPLLKNYRSLTAQLPLFSNNQELSIAEALVPILIKGRSASYSSYSTHRGVQPSSVMKVLALSCKQFS